MKADMIDDGYSSFLVEDSSFDGIFEIPHIFKPKEIKIPTALIPFSMRNQSKDYSEAIMFYEHDKKISTVLTATTKYLEELKQFPIVISPDCSLYRDMPLTLQITNTYMNRAIGSYFQNKGLYVIPNIRWGDEHSFTTKIFPEKFAFTGIEKKSIVSIGTYGCCQKKEDKFYLKEGLKAMLEELEPIVVLVYGAMPKSIFGEFMNRTKFVHFDDWTKVKHHSKR